MKTLGDQTLYEVLDVPCDAPQSDILRAYERAQALYGPGSIATFTLVAPDEAAVLGARLEEARTVLLDPIARAGYDAQLSGTRAPTPGSAEDGTSGYPAARCERSQPLGVPPIIPALRAKPPTSGAAARQPSHPRDLASTTPSPAEPSWPRAAASGSDEPQPEVRHGERDQPAPIALDTVAMPIPLAALAPAPLPAPAPIPLSTLVPVSPPFAAVAAQGPAAAAPAPPASVALAPAPSRAPRPLQREIFVPEGTRFTGDVLRRAREARGLTVQALSERTRITRHHIENLEGDRYEKLPAPVYLRGFLMAMSKELRLDGQKVARSYLEAIAAAPEAPPSPSRSRSRGGAGD